MSTNVLSDRDINTSASNPTSDTDKDTTNVKSMEYHRQVLQNRMADDKQKQTYVSPSDTIMSPCTAKLSAMKNKHFMKAKPQSLFAKTSSKNLSNSSSESSLASSSGIDGDVATEKENGA